MLRHDFENQHVKYKRRYIKKKYYEKNTKMTHTNTKIVLMTLMVPYLSAALGVRVTLKDVSHHGNVTFLHCPVEGSLSILMEKDKVSHGLRK